MSPGDLFFWTFLPPGDACRLYRGYGCYPYIPVGCHGSCAWYCLRRLSDTLPLGQFLNQFSSFRFSYSSPGTLTRGGYSEGHEASSPLEKSPFGDEYRARASVDTAWARTFLHCSEGGSFFRFPSSNFHLYLFGCRLMGILWLLVVFFFDWGDICLHCSYGLTLFYWLVCLGWLVPVPMKISPRVWGFKIFWTFSTEIALCSFIPHEEYSDGIPTIIWFLISISDQTFNSLYTYVL